jgi:hypothetical protein
MSTSMVSSLLPEPLALCSSCKPGRRMVRSGALHSCWQKKGCREDALVWLRVTLPKGHPESPTLGHLSLSSARKIHQLPCVTDCGGRGTSEGNFRPARYFCRQGQLSTFQCCSRLEGMHMGLRKHISQDSVSAAWDWHG